MPTSEKGDKAEASHGASSPGGEQRNHHSLLRTKAMLRRPRGPPSPETVTTLSSRSFTPRIGCSRSLLEVVKGSLLSNRSVDTGTGHRNSDILRCSMEYMVDDDNDDQPIAELEDAQTLLRDRSEFQNSLGTLTSHNDGSDRESRTFNIVEWVVNDVPAPADRPAIQPNDDLWENMESAMADGISGNVRDDDHFDDRSLANTVLTAVVVDETQERLRSERESRQAGAGAVVLAEVVDVRKRRLVVVSTLLVVIVVIVSLVTTLVAKKSNADKSATMATSIGLVQQSEWLAIVNAVSLSESNLAYPAPEQASTGEKALAWLIEESDGVTERRATQRFAFVVLALSWKNSEWNITSDFDECGLKGVTCDAHHSCIEMDLTSAGLVGTIPPEIALLTDMRKLVLWHNELTGPVPWEPMLQRMSKMKSIDLDINRLKGSLPKPTPGTWPQIEKLGVGWNRFTGTIPTSFVHWPALAGLIIRGNHLTGTIPSELGGLSAMNWFAANDNDLRGTLPTEIARWTKIRFFEVYGNRGLSGTIPSGLGQWSLIQDFQCHSNNFHGPLPMDISRWSNIQRFHADFNSFSGTLPIGMSGWRKLTSLHINNNDFAGPLPTGIGNWVRLEEIHMNNNRLSGALPSGLDSWGNLKQAYLQENSFSGSVDRLCDTAGAGLFVSADCCEVDCSCCSSCSLDSGIVDPNCTIPASASP